MTVVLHHAPRRLAELHANRRAIRGGDLQRVAGCIAQARNAAVMRQSYSLVAQDDIPRRGVACVLFAWKRPRQAKALALEVFRRSEIPDELSYSLVVRRIAAKIIRHFSTHNRRIVLADNQEGARPRSVIAGIFVVPSAKDAAGPPACVKQLWLKMAAATGRKRKSTAIRDDDILGDCIVQAGHECEKECEKAFLHSFILRSLSCNYTTSAPREREEPPCKAIQRGTSRC